MAGADPCSAFGAPSNIRVTCLTLPVVSGQGTVAAMKLKSNKANWATVLCAAAVFSLISLRDAQAELPKPGIMPPPPIVGSTDQPSQIRPILPAQPIDNDLGSDEQLNGDFIGTMIID